MFGYEKSCNITELIGKTLVSIRGMEKDSSGIAFVCSDGSEYSMYHEQDCCESVWLEDVSGDVNCLLNSPIFQASENTSHDGPLDKDDEEFGTFTWTFYTFATIKGYVTLRWYGTSNGYYSESVDFFKTKEAFKNKEGAIKLLDEEFRHYATPDEEWAIDMAISALKEKENGNEN